MTQEQIIKKIIADMHPIGHSRFFDIWSRVTGYPKDGKEWKNSGKRIFTEMINRGLIRHIRNDHDDAITVLKQSGVDVKNNVTTPYDYSALRSRSWKFTKEFFVWFTLGGLSTLVLIWQLVLPYFSSNEEDKKLKSDTTKIERQQQIQIPSDTLKSIQKADSLPNDTIVK